MENVAAYQAETNSTVGTKTERICALDNYRGLIIILMTITGFFASMNVIPSWLKHPADFGFSIVDVGAPAFLFGIALTYRDAFERRRKGRGLGYTYNHFFMRYASMIGLGALAMAVRGVYDGISMSWSVLHAIGFAGLITLAVIRIPTNFRALIGVAIIVVYQVLLDAVFLDRVLAARDMHGGLLGAFSWSGMLILFTVISDWFKKGGKKYLLAVPIFLAMFALSYFAFKVGVSKTRISASYVFLTIALAVALFGIFDTVPFLNKPIPFVTWWGENPLLFYIADMVAIAGTIVLLGGFERVNALPLWSVPLVVLWLVAVMGSLCFFTHKKGIKFKL